MADDVYIDEHGVETRVPAVRAPLQACKEALWATAKEKRDSLINGGLLVPGIGTFDTSEPSRGYISGAVTAAVLATLASQPFSVSWTLADNSSATLDASEMQYVGVTIMSKVSAIHNHARAIAASILAAQDYAALDAIDIVSGWPV